jgi:hypothetical protein
MLKTTGSLRPKPQTRPLTTSALMMQQEAPARVDPKGKVFTERVRTQPVEVQMLTTQGFIQGFVHVNPGQRLKDMMNNHSEQFLAITNAIFVPDEENPENQEQEEVMFIAINKAAITYIIPLDEERPAPTEEDYIAF